MLDFKSEPAVTLVDFMGGDDSVAMSAWVSYGRDSEDRLSDRKRVEGLINFLMREGHMTPFESSVFTFRVETPIFVSREVRTHRTQSQNEISGRYTKLPQQFYCPSKNRPIQQVGKPGAYEFVPGTEEQWAVLIAEFAISIHQAVRSYERMLEAGIAKEVARDVLPVGQYTQLYMTVNARNLMHFLDLRTAPDALFEIRQVASRMESYFEECMPMTYKAWIEHGNR